MINTIMFLTNIKFFDIDIINPNIIELLIRFFFNFFIIVFIIRYLYYTGSKRKDYIFTYIMISSAIFLLVFLLESVKIKLGFALGLFVVFSIIRYRTNQIPIKEMTYLFIVITLSVINGITSQKISYVELIVSNLIVISLIYFLEKIWLVNIEQSKKIIYEKIELIHPDKRKELLADLEKRTGIKIHRIEIGQIDFLKDTAKIKIYFFNNQQTKGYGNYIFNDNDDSF